MEVLAQQTASLAVLEFGKLFFTDIKSCSAFPLSTNLTVHLCLRQLLSEVRIWASVQGN